MRLVPFTFDGGTISNGTTLTGVIETEGQVTPSSNILSTNRTNNFPVYAGKELQGKYIPLIIELSSGTLIDGLNQILDVTDTDEHQFICKDEGNSDKQWYVDAVVERHMEFGPNHSEYVLYAADPVWKSVTEGTASWSGTASPGTVTVTPAGNKDALPVFEITATSLKGVQYAYKRFITAYNQMDKYITGKYPLNLTDNGSGTAYMAGSALVAGTKLQSDGDDLRIIVDGRQVNRWFGGAVNSGTTKVWSNIAIPYPKTELIATSAIGTADTFTEIEFADTNATKRSLDIMKAQGILRSPGGELFTYTSIDKKLAKVSGVTRAAKSTAAGTLAANGTLTYVPHNIWMLYGNPAASAPEQDPDETGFNPVKYYDAEPVINLTLSNNVYWAWNPNFTDAEFTRTANWQPKILSRNNKNCGYYYGNRGTADSDPATELGVTVQAVYWNYGWRPGNAEIAWDIYQPIGFGTINYSGEKYAGTSKSWPWVGFEVGRAENEPKMTRNTISEPSNYGSWQAFSGSILPTNPSGVARYMRWKIDGAVAGAGTAAVPNASYAEINAINGSMAAGSAPYVSMGAELTTYYLDMKISRGSDWIKLTGPIDLNETLTVDCKNKTITMGDGTNAINYLTLSSNRDEWLTLNPGADNYVIFTEADMVAVTVDISWEDRNL